MEDGTVRSGRRECDGGYGALWQRLPAAPPYCPKAVKADFDRIHDPKTQSRRRMAVIDSVNLLGLYQVEILLNRAYAAFLGEIRRTKIPVQSPTAVERYAATNSFKASVGTGGYKFISC